ncbi:MAG: hypothetical protein AAFQ68_06230 [Bacteroidota bacterium]
MRSSSKQAYFWLLLIWGLSLLLRWDGPYRTPGGAHFWLSAQSLQTMEIWTQEGIRSYTGNQVETYPTSANHGLPISGHTFLSDTAGNYYYTSYPPFGLYLPYWGHQLLGSSASVWSLRCFSLLLYSICLYLMYKLLAAFCKSDWAFIGTAAFAFSPGPLYYLSHLYFSDMLALVWLFLLLLLIQGQISGTNRWGWIALINFCACYTEWLGMLFALFAGIWLTWRYQDRRWFWVMGTSGLLALGLCIWQYSQIAGLEALLQQWAGRLDNQSGLGLPLWRSLGFGFALNQFRNYAGLLLLLPLIWILTWQKGPKGIPTILILAGFAPFLHQLLFLGFGYLHDFAGLKSGAFWTILLVWRSQSLDLRQSKNQIVLSLCGLALIAFGTYRYHQYVGVEDDNIALGQHLSQLLQEDDPQQDCRLWIDREPNPILHYYLKRNLGWWKEGEAYTHLDPLDCELLIKTQDLSQPTIHRLHEK